MFDDISEEHGMNRFYNFASIFHIHGLDFMVALPSDAVHSIRPPGGAAPDRPPALNEYFYIFLDVYLAAALVGCSSSIAAAPTRFLRRYHLGSSAALRLNPSGGGRSPCAVEPKRGAGRLKRTLAPPLG